MVHPPGTATHRNRCRKIVGRIWVSKAQSPLSSYNCQTPALEWGNQGWELGC